MTILVELAQVRVGYTYRGSLKNAHEGDLAVIQMKDATPHALHQTTGLARISLPELAAHYLLQCGDLVFRSRGLHNQAWVYAQPGQRSICIAPLMFIHIHDQTRLLPSYLEWFINLDSTQAKIARMARGSTIAMISAAALQSLEIVVPAPERQQKIIDIYQLYQQSRQLQEELARKRLQYTQTALLHYARGQSIG